MILVVQSGTQLRAYEQPNLEKYFGQVVICEPKQAQAMMDEIGPEYCYWRPDTERTKFPEWIELMRCAISDAGDKVKHINYPAYFDYVQCKERAWKIWKRSGIRCPDWFVFHDRDCFYDKQRFTYPYLLRLNNSVSGHESYFVERSGQVDKFLWLLYKDFEKPRYGGGIRCERICQEFIETRDENGYRSSYRIIVAGNKVITGYARLTGGDDWVAITGKFKSEMAENWVEHQKRCQRFIEQNHDEIVRSVLVLGLDFQGVDILVGQDDWYYFLEVQPGFSVGYLNAEANGWYPPFYNPSKPKELVQFLIDNEDRLRDEIPLYYENWLDKNRLFDLSFGAIKEKIDAKS